LRSFVPRPRRVDAARLGSDIGAFLATC